MSDLRQWGTYAEISKPPLHMGNSFQPTKRKIHLLFYCAFPFRMASSKSEKKVIKKEMKKKYWRERRKVSQKKKVFPVLTEGFRRNFCPSHIHTEIKYSFKGFPPRDEIISFSQNYSKCPRFSGHAEQLHFRIYHHLFKLTFSISLTNQIYVHKNGNILSYKLYHIYKRY